MASTILGSIPGKGDLSQGPLRDAAISTLTYQSRAVEAPSGIEIQSLMQRAKARNHAAGVTGMLLMNEGRFFQWLEGPDDAVSAIWASIQADPRHDQIEVLSRDSAQHRLFSEWDMRLVCQDGALGPFRDQVNARRALPQKLIDLVAQLAVDGAKDVLCEGLEDVITAGVDIVSIYSDLIEPAARRLGDWWQEDRCGTCEIALALSCLQTSVRKIAEAHTPPLASGPAPRRVLVAPQPGEAHMLGLALVSDLYRQAGWRVDTAFPKTDAELADLVGQTRFDAINLSTSDVFARLDRINILAATIRAARYKSRNPGLVVTVGGRAFIERPDLATLIGADATYSTLADAISQTEQAFASHSPSDTVN